MNKLEYSELENLVNSDDYEGAKAYCRARLSSGNDWRFWLTQLGYVCFLHFRDHVAYYIQTPAIFETLVATDLNDVNAHFWNGYIRIIVNFFYERGVEELRAALALDPDHPYANWIMEGRVDQFEWKENHLQRVLKRQPNNFRALLRLADLMLSVGRITEARHALEKITTEEPYIERDYGIMNKYINGVLTGAIWKQRLREEARTKLEQLR